MALDAGGPSAARGGHRGPCLSVCGLHRAPEAGCISAHVLSAALPTWRIHPAFLDQRPRDVLNVARRVRDSLICEACSLGRFHEGLVVHLSLVICKAGMAEMWMERRHRKAILVVLPVSVLMC